MKASTAAMAVAAYTSIPIAMLSPKNASSTCLDRNGTLLDIPVVDIPKSSLKLVRLPGITQSSTVLRPTKTMGFPDFTRTDASSTNTFASSVALATSLAVQFTTIEPTTTSVAAATTSLAGTDSPSEHQESIAVSYMILLDLTLLLMILMLLLLFLVYVRKRASEKNDAEAYSSGSKRAGDTHAEAVANSYSTTSLVSSTPSTALSTPVQAKPPLAQSGSNENTYSQKPPVDFPNAVFPSSPVNVYPAALNDTNLKHLYNPNKKPINSYPSIRPAESAKPAIGLFNRLFWNHQPETINEATAGLNPHRRFFDSMSLANRSQNVGDFLRDTSLDTLVELDDISISSSEEQYPERAPERTLGYDYYSRWFDSEVK